MSEFFNMGGNEGKSNSGIPVCKTYDALNNPNGCAIAQVKKKKRANVITYLAIVLITSVITSTAVGGVLYFKFSSDLDKKLGHSNISAIASKNGSSTVLNGIMKIGLDKGSPVTQIAKKVGPSVVGIRMTYANLNAFYFSHR